MGEFKMYEICLDTSTYLLPCDVVPKEGNHKNKIEDQKATFRIKQLAEEGIVKLFIPANVHIKLRKHHNIEKRKEADEF
jgi:hypothetical protein